MPTHHLRNIELHDLYGRLSYNIPVNHSQDESTGLAILFGDNGCGKTTLLNLLHHSLSPAPRANHRTSLSKIPFKYFKVDLSSNISITISKPNVDSRDYTIVVTSDNIEEFQLKYGTIESERDQVAADEYSNLLKRYGINISMLTADRLSLYKSRRRLKSSRDGEVWFHEINDPDSTISVDHYLEGATRWAQRAIIESLNEGQVSTERIYLDVAKKLLSPLKIINDENELSVDNFKTSLYDVKYRLNHSSDFGLVPSKTALDTIELAINANDYNMQQLAGILSPFINGLSARLDAITQIESVISTFVNTLSDFIIDKQITFDRKNGFGIELTDSRKPISATQLSSGEQQLLIMFCNVLMKRDSGGVLIVDEPELSLNPQWQRRLIDSLIKCAQYARIQFVLATHSTAILAQHKVSSVEMRIDRAKQLNRDLGHGDTSLFNS